MSMEYTLLMTATTTMAAAAAATVLSQFRIFGFNVVYDVRDDVDHMVVEFRTISHAVSWTAHAILIPIHFHNFRFLLFVQFEECVWHSRLSLFPQVKRENAKTTLKIHMGDRRRRRDSNIVNCILYFFWYQKRQNEITHASTTANDNGQIIIMYHQLMWIYVFDREPRMNDRREK